MHDFSIYQTVPDDWDQFYLDQQSAHITQSLAKFYRASLVDEDRLIRQAEFVALDIETTGLNALEDDIVSIGLVPFDYRRIYLAKAQYWLVRSRQLTSESIVVHGITHTDVANAPALIDVLPEVIQALQAKVVVVHYRYMEREFFRRAVAELFNDSWLFPVVDTLEMEAQYQRMRQSLLGKWMQKSLPSLRLPNVRQRYHLPSYENHNALTDALATAELWQAQIRYQGLENRSIRAFWK